MTTFGLPFVIVGIAGIVATRLGWYDRGGLMRRLDRFGLYGFMERSWVGGGVRRANYTISALLVLVGLLVLLRAA